MDVGFVNLVKDKEILPGINELVDILYTENINNYLDFKIESNDDKRVLIMFIMMYFYSYLAIPQKNKTEVSSENIKQSLKIFLSDLISNRNKRQKCLDMYRNFENGVLNLKNN